MNDQVRIRFGTLSGLEEVFRRQRRSTSRDMGMFVSGSSASILVSLVKNLLRHFVDRSVIVCTSERSCTTTSANSFDISEKSITEVSDGIYRVEYIERVKTLRWTLILGGAARKQLSLIEIAKKSSVCTRSQPFLDVSYISILCDALRQIPLAFHNRVHCRANTSSTWILFVVVPEYRNFKKIVGEPM